MLKRIGLALLVGGASIASNAENNSPTWSPEYQCGEDTTCIREIIDDLVGSDSASAASQGSADEAVSWACYLPGGRYKFYYVASHYPESRCEEVARNGATRGMEEREAYRMEEAARIAEAKARREREAEASASRAAALAKSLLPPEQVQEVAGMMFGIYSGGGPELMMQAENQCWDDVPGREPERSTVASACALASMAGTLIEAAYAQQEGRMPVPNYNAGLSTERAHKKMAAAGLSGAEVEAIYADTVAPNIEILLFGLMNAGMR